MVEHGSGVDFSTRLSFRCEARNPHSRGLERQQIPRFARNGNRGARNDNVGINKTPSGLDSQLDYRRATAAFVLGRFDDRFDVRVLLQILTQRFAENSHTAAMNDTDSRHPSKESAVDELLYFSCGVVHGAADHVDLRGHTLVLTLQGNRNSARPSGFDRRV